MVTFNNDITVYSRWRKGREEHWIRTPIEKVSWFGHQGANIGESGLVTADQYVIRVRFWTMGAYIRPDSWNALNAKPRGVWTIQNGDIIVKGIVTDEVTGGNIADLTKKYTECFTVTAWYDNRRELLQHLRIEGK